MPLAGIWAAKGEISFPAVMILSVLAGLAGSWLLYLLGRIGGARLLGFYFRKFPGQKEAAEKKIAYLREKGCIGVFYQQTAPGSEGRSSPSPQG